MNCALRAMHQTVQRGHPVPRYPLLSAFGISGGQRGHTRDIPLNESQHLSGARKSHPFTALDVFDAPAPPYHPICIIFPPLAPKTDDEGVLGLFYGFRHNCSGKTKRTAFFFPEQSIKGVSKNYQKTKRLRSGWAVHRL